MYKEQKKIIEIIFFLNKKQIGKPIEILFKNLEKEIFKFCKRRHKDSIHNIVKINNFSYLPITKSMLKEPKKRPYNKKIKTDEDVRIKKEYDEKIRTNTLYKR